MSENAKPQTPPRKRVGILDLWRTIAIVCMVVYHLLFDLYIFGVITADTMFSTGLNAFERFICVSFILLAGISSRFSRSNIKRGIITLACAAVVSIAGYVADEPIWFGILHFLGCAMLLYGLCVRAAKLLYGLCVKAVKKSPPRGKLLEKLSGVITPLVCLAMFFALYRLTESVTVASKLLFAFGFTFPGFYSADFFPLLPWLFLFLIGAWLGGIIKKDTSKLSDDNASKLSDDNASKLSDRLYSPRIPPALTFPGRHSLLIYMLHQPILYGLVYIFTRG